MLPGLQSGVTTLPRVSETSKRSLLGGALVQIARAGERRLPCYPEFETQVPRSKLGQENQAATPYLVYATVIWTGSANSLQAWDRSLPHQMPDGWQHPTTRHDNPDALGR
jgi:hypothetical protein